MSLPGFSAERAVYRGHTGYSARIRHAPGSQLVIPQVINQACWIRAALRTSIRCMNLGYSSDVCTQVAVDLADSVCDF